MHAVLRKITRGRRTPLLRVLLSALLAGSMLAITTQGASAAETRHEFLTVHKSVSHDTIEPDEPFTYTIKVACNEEDCVNAQLTDQFPAELDGYALNHVAINPNDSEHELTWSQADQELGSEPDTMSDDTRLDVTFNDDLGSGEAGLTPGQDITLTVTLQAPTDLDPGEYTFTNTASTTADNSAPDEESATTTLRIPSVLGVDVSKKWSPTEQPYEQDQASTITLGATNTSNGPVEELVIHEPQTAEDGATGLEASNPFTITDLDQVSVSLPDGATQARIDAYVKEGGSYQWVEGAADANPGLPGSVDAADVAGIRVVYTGDAIQREETGTLKLDLKQRASHRDSGEALDQESHTVDNIARGTVTAIDESESDTAKATHTITPPGLNAKTGKTIDPNRISAGEGAHATIRGTNGSDVAVNELRLSDLDFFTEDITFGGFTDGIVWPTGADDAKVVYHLLDGGTEDVTFTDGETPTDPSKQISGFEIVFTADGDNIESGQSVSAEFDIYTSEDTVNEGEDLETSNDLTTTVSLDNGRSAEADDSADLRVVYPAVDVSLAKTIRPTATVHPGENVVTKLKSNLTTTSDYVSADRIVVEDTWNNEDGDFWDAFNLDSVVPTQVPGDTSLTIEVYDGTEWHEAGSFDSQDSPFIASLDGDDIASTGVDTDQLTGIRFTFEHDDEFANDTTVTPYFSATARSQLRSGDDITATEQDYENLATTTGDGHTEAGTELTDTDEDDSRATVATSPGGPGQVGIHKSWNDETIAAQSGHQTSTTLSWRVAAGFETVAITDPTERNVADSVFDVFNLTALNAIDASNDVYSNGWFLKYDTIDQIELYDGDTWNTVAAPGGSWQKADGSFKGYELPEDQQDSTTRVRITIEENIGARNKAQQGGEAYDPYAPKPDTGVATSSSHRTFDLTWQVRDKKRSDDSWVRETAQFNTDDDGLVDNTTQLDATPIDGSNDKTANDNDTILIKDYDPGVTASKTAMPENPLYVPMEDTTDAADYPTGTFKLTAKNDSVARASYVRVMDPPACADTASIDACQSDGTADGATADPFDTSADWLETSPFERFDMTGVSIDASIADEVDLDETTVWLLTYDGSFDTIRKTATQANAMTAGDLAEVVGISVTYQGTDPAATGGTITAANTLSVTLDTRLRPTYRSSGEPQLLEANTILDVSNRVFAQSYDPILNDGRQTGELGADALALTGGDIKIKPKKTIDPGALTEPTRGEDVTVELSANQGGSTLTTAEVRLTDDTADAPEFWDQFDLTGLSDIDAPQGADQIRVAVHGPYGDEDAMEWVDGGPTPISDAELPDVDLSKTEGIRFTFNRQDGEFFSDEDPGDPKWDAAAAFTVQLRDTYRDSGQDVTMSGSVDDTVTAISDRNNGEKSEEKAADDVIELSTGTFELEVNKLANDGTRTVNAGDTVPWDLTIRNSGTGYLDISEVRDTLPEHLKYLGDDPEYTADSDGGLSEDVTLTQDGDDLVFTWPEGDNRMEPSEEFTIRVPLEMQPGLTSGEQTTNTMVATTAQELERCANTESGGSVTDDWNNDKHTCGDTDYVQPQRGTNLFTAKGVIGALDGASIPSTGQECQATLEADDQQYFRSGCAANSVIGGTDDWILRSVNAGTTDIDNMVVFDQLPVPGDKTLLAGRDRGSDYRPQLVDSLQTNVPEGTSVTVEVTESDDVCVGTWADLNAQAPCEQNEESWQEEDGDTDWSAVSGLRITMDFTTSEAGSLKPGDRADVTYSSTNMPATGSNADGAPVDVPADDSYAWNQFGIKYQKSGEDAYRKLAPADVGVHLLTGPIGVVKDVAGPAADYAPDEFTAAVACTIEGADVDMGDVGQLTLSDGEPARIDGIPYGASCTVSEDGDVGEFGETSRDPGSTTVEVTRAATEDGTVPQAQIAELGNTYEFAGLTVEKTVATEADTGEFGPFDFELTCQSATGEPVSFGDTDELSFTLEDGQAYDAPEDTIPAGSVCTVAELTGSADDIVVTGDNVTAKDDGTAEVTVPQSGAHVNVTNGYDAGTLTVTKTSNGDGAEIYGAGPFEFTAVCSYQDQELLNEDFMLDAGSNRSFGTFPAGTDCQVHETATGGANETALSPGDGVVTITGPDDGEDVSNIDVVATNTFRLGELAIDKEVTGPGAELYGAGPFTAQVACTWERDGDDVTIPLSNDGVVELSAANEYTATIGDLLVGATCSVSESDRGGADSSTISPDDGNVTITGDEAAQVTLTNTFEVTSLAVSKDVDGPVDDDTAFDVTLACTREVNDETQPVDIPGGAVRTLTAPDDLDAAYDRLPLGAACTLEETDTGGAAQTTMTVEGQETVEGTSADVDLDSEETGVTITNTFEAKGESGTGGLLPGAGSTFGPGIFAAIIGLLLVGLALFLKNRKAA